MAQQLSTPILYIRCKHRLSLIALPLSKQAIRIVLFPTHLATDKAILRFRNPCLRYTRPRYDLSLSFWQCFLFAQDPVADWVNAAKMLQSEAFTPRRTTEVGLHTLLIGLGD